MKGKEIKWQMSRKGCRSTSTPLTVDMLCLQSKSSQRLQSSLSRWILQPSCRFSDPSWCSDILFPASYLHLNRHVKKCVMWKVCLVRCASLIMGFPSIPVSPHPSPSHHASLPLSWRPYLFGAGCFAIKTPWWVLLFPLLTPSAACSDTLYQTRLLCLFVCFTCLVDFWNSSCHFYFHCSKGKNPKEAYFFPLFFCIFGGCLHTFCTVWQIVALDGVILPDKCIHFCLMSNLS